MSIAESPAWRKARQAIMDKIDVVLPTVEQLRRLERVIDLMQVRERADRRRDLHGERVWPRKPGR